MLFTCGQHAREHLTIEMCLYLLNELTSKYAHRHARSRTSSNSREIWIVPNLNPDGSEYDIATGSLPLVAQEPPAELRARARSAPTSTATGASSGAAAAARAARSRRRPTAAPSAFSAPETAARARLRQQPRRRRRAADQGRTSTSTPTPSSCCGRTATRPRTRRPALTADDQAALSHARRAAWPRPTATRPSRRSDLYIADGTIDDWLWGAHKIFGYTFEMYPRTLEPGLLSARLGDRAADDPQPRGRAAAARRRRLPVRGDRQADQYCGAGAAADGLQRHLRDRDRLDDQPDGTDTATTGALGARATRPTTNSSGAKQLGTTVSGTNRPRDRRRRRAPTPATNDIDGGTTTIRSPAITLPAGNRDADASAGTSRTARTRRRRTSSACGRRHDGTTRSFQQLGAATNRNGAWATPIGEPQRVRRPDGPDPDRGGRRRAPPSLVEAGVDDVRVTPSPG